MSTDTLAKRIAEMKRAAEPFRDEPYTEGCSHCRMHMRRLNEEVTPAAVLALIAHVEQLEREVAGLKSVVDAAVEWRRVGYERKDEFAYRIGPLIDAIDIYDVGHKRPCEEP